MMRALLAWQPKWRAYQQAAGGSRPKSRSSCDWRRQQRDARGANKKAKEAHVSISYVRVKKRHYVLRAADQLQQIQSIATDRM
jgi:hypothetical protein